MTGAEIPRMDRDDLKLLADALAERVAPLVAEAIAERLCSLYSLDALPKAAPGALLDARQVAELLGVSRRWVYDNAKTLGAMHVGDGARPRLRFDPATVTGALDSRPASKGLEPRQAPRRRRSRRVRSAPGVIERPLLPIHAPGDV